MPLWTVGCGDLWSTLDGRSRSEPRAPTETSSADRYGSRRPATCSRPSEARGSISSKTGIATSITFGASGRLAEQIKQGAAFDVFLAANQAFVRIWPTHGLIKPESVHPYARVAGPGGVP